jgi:hypothetical protein
MDRMTSATRDYNETQLHDRLTLAEITAQLSFPDRAIVRFTLMGWELPDLDVSKVAWHRVIREMRQLSGERKRCIICKRHKPAKHYSVNGNRNTTPIRSKCTECERAKLTEAPQPPKNIDYVCAHCGNAFQNPRPRATKHRTLRYCSQQCVTKSMKPGGKHYRVTRERY